MEQYPIFDDVDINDIYKDLNKALYMLHYLDQEIFSKEEIQDVAFAIKVSINTLDKKIQDDQLHSKKV